MQALTSNTTVHVAFSFFTYKSVSYVVSLCLIVAISILTNDTLNLKEQCHDVLVIFLITLKLKKTSK